MKYSFKQFLADYPDDEACLAEIVGRKYADWRCSCGRTRLYKVRKRPVYACPCGKQVNPLADTVFAHTKLPLTYWFYTIYLMSMSKRGVSAAEVSRHLGVKYDTAWRMCYKLRQRMIDEVPLQGEVEADETYVRAKPWRTTKPLAYNGRARTVLGMVERGGRARAVVIPTNSSHFIQRTVRDHVLPGSKLYSDAAFQYRPLSQYYKHQSVNHSQREWVRDDVYTQTIEGFWSGVKLGLQGTHKGVSPEYLQNYLNHFSWSYSNRFSENAFADLLAQVSRQ